MIISRPKQRKKVILIFVLNTKNSTNSFQQIVKKKVKSKQIQRNKKRKNIIYLSDTTFL